MKKVYAYSFSLAAAALAFIAWGQGQRWAFDHLSTYTIFPLLGLLAFSLLWSTYMVSSIRRHSQKNEELETSYYKPVRLAIIILIVLHPTLLIWQLWRDGFGFPPGSYLNNYVTPSLKWAAVLSSFAFLVFLTYELKFKFGKRSWWRYVEYAGDLAMFAIFVHALELGSNLQHGWYRAVWWFYGLTLVIVLTDLYRLQVIKHRQKIS